MDRRRRPTTARPGRSGRPDSTRRSATARAAALAALVAVAGAAGCDRNVGTLEVELVTSDIREQHPFSAPVHVVRVRVEAGTDGVVVDELPYEPEGEARLPAVPVGLRRVIEVQGLTRDGLERSRGRSLPFDVRPGTNRLALYVGAKDTFSRSAPPLAPARGAPRGAHHAVTLGDDRVLLVGGSATLAVVEGTWPGDPRRIQLGEPVGGADLFDPTSARIVEGADGCTDGAGGGTEPFCLRVPRTGSVAGPTPEGAALIAGGADSGGRPTSAVEVLAPGRDGSTLVNDTLSGRTGAAVAPTPAGLLVLGGWTEGDLEAPARSGVLVLDSGRELRPLPDLLECARAGHEAVVLGDVVLLVGGLGEEGIRSDYEVLSLDPPESMGCRELPPEVTPRAGVRATAVDDRVAAVVGGYDESGGISGEVDLIDLRTGTFCPVRVLTEGRMLHGVTTLADRSVLVVGGLRQWSLDERTLPSGSVRLDLGRALALLAAAAATGRAVPCESLGVVPEPDVRSLTQPRVAPSVTLLDNGLVLVAGGFAPSDGRAVASAEVFVP